MAGTDVIRWGAPVPSFGDLSRATVATLGLNPSNREFVDIRGRELRGLYRRFHTLTSLRLTSWSQATADHLRLILSSCETYFLGNPYDRWFRRLDEIVAAVQGSYYGVGAACHLDLIPYATARKWTELTFRQRSSLLGVAADTLGILLRDSPVRLLILNGTSVVERFQDVMGIRLARHEMSGWTLHRSKGGDIQGIGYIGTVTSLSGISLGRSIHVIGYNHNIQSSFGITKVAVAALRDWVRRAATEALH